MGIDEKNIYNVTVQNGQAIIANDNSKYEATVEKEEVDLALYLKTSVFKHLKSSEQSKLLQLIEDFGSMKYVDGSNDNAI